jgi:hypothetical protein
MAGKRKEGDLVAPDIMEDAGERKRILNVLAQRRYRRFFVPTENWYFELNRCRTEKKRSNASPGSAI